jgi:transcriptional antiterminator RfaH
MKALKHGDMITDQGSKDTVLGRFVLGQHRSVRSSSLDLNSTDLALAQSKNAGITDPMSSWAISETASDPLSWYAIHTKPKEENRAGDNLHAWNVETFTPQIREHRCNQFAVKPTYGSKPLFPRYIFARFAASMLQKVRFTRGVQNIVEFGRVPAQIDDEIIEVIKSRMKNGFVKIDDDLKAGDEVIIKDGPLKSFVGVFKHQVGSSDRVLIMLTAVSYQPRIVIKRDVITSVSR